MSGAAAEVVWGSTAGKVVSGRCIAEADGAISCRCNDGGEVSGAAAGRDAPCSCCWGAGKSGAAVGVSCDVLSDETISCRCIGGAGAVGAAAEERTWPEEVICSCRWTGVSLVPVPLDICPFSSSGERVNTSARRRSSGGGIWLGLLILFCLACNVW